MTTRTTGGGPLDASVFPSEGTGRLLEGETGVVWTASRNPSSVPSPTSNFATSEPQKTDSCSSSPNTTNPSFPGAENQSDTEKVWGMI